MDPTTIIALIAAAFFAFVAVGLACCLAKTHEARAREIESKWTRSRRAPADGSDPAKCSEVTLAAVPLMDYIKDHGDFHTIAVVQMDRVDLYQAKEGGGYPLND